MTQQKSRNDFIEYIAKIYTQNPELPVNYQTIYHELSIWDSDEEIHKLVQSSLVSIQVGIKNHFKNNNKANIFSMHGYLVIENRNGKKDKDFYNEISSGIKMYVPVDAENLFYVAVNIFTYMLDNNITMQCKVSKSLRTDSLVLRVSSIKEAKEVEDYINRKLNYQSSIKTNPFLLNHGKVSYALDGNSSYNMTLAKLMEDYFQEKRNSNSLDNSSSLDFSKFIKNRRKELEKGGNLQTNDKTNHSEDILMIIKEVGEILDNSLDLDRLATYQKVLSLVKKTPESSEEETPNKVSILSIIAGMSAYYSTSDIHKIIMHYLNTGEENIFTRRDGIRYQVKNNFTPKTMKQIIEEIGWNTFIKNCSSTYDRYGYEQTVEAVRRLLTENNLSFFTNEEEDRSRLALVIPIELLKEEIMKRTQVANPSIVVDIALSQIKKQNKSK